MDKIVAPKGSLPTKAFADANLELVEWDPVPHYRAFKTRYPDPLGYRPAESRFSDPRLGEDDVDPYSTIYFATDVETCLLETVIRDNGVGIEKKRIPFSESFLKSWSIVEVAAKAPLALLDLRGAGTVANRIPTDAIRAQDQTLGRAWSLAIHEHKDQPDGLIFSSRLNEKPNVAVFDRAMRNIDVVTHSPLFDGYRTELAHLLDTYKISLE